MGDIFIRHAERIGAKGAKATEEDRATFEAWMRGHCWRVCGVWDGTTYGRETETGEFIDPDVSLTRMLFAAWRDRRALERAFNEAEFSHVGHVKAWASPGSGSPYVSANWEELPPDGALLYIKKVNSFGNDGRERIWENEG